MSAASELDLESARPSTDDGPPGWTCRQWCAQRDHHRQRVSRLSASAKAPATRQSLASRTTGSITFVLRSKASTIVRCSVPLAAEATTGITCR